jgi:hypothetical protein
VAKFRNTRAIIKTKTNPVYPLRPSMGINSAAVGKAIRNTNILKSRAELQAKGPLQQTFTCGQVFSTWNQERMRTFLKQGTGQKLCKGNSPSMD